MTAGFQKNLESKIELRKRNRRSEFLKGISEMADMEFLAASESIEKNFESEQKNLRKELSDILNQIYENYKGLQEKHSAGELRWICFSFLRCGLMDEYPAYRIDFYDERDWYADVECCGNWRFEYVFSGFYEIRVKIRNALSAQCKVKDYEADEILFDLYDRFHGLAAALLTRLVQKSMLPMQLLEKGEIGIKEGELFDSTNLIGRWRGDKNGGWQI